MTDDATLDRAGRLPSELSGLIGRRRELAELSALLAGTRLLTLTGPGGAGKSRLALALAEARRDQDVGVWWADLAGAAGAGMVTQLVAGAIVPPRQGCADAVEGIARVLAGRPALLCLDNCEHVAEACAELTAALLGECAELSVLATSRRSPRRARRAGVARRRAWRCPRPTGRGHDEGAVELFAERARRADPGFSLDGARAAVIRICRRLDGIPLAIELAAARVTVLTPDQIAERLRRDSRLLSQGPSTAPARHRTLTATLDWSHRMLDARRAGGVPAAVGLPRLVLADRLRGRRGRGRPRRR